MTTNRLAAFLVLLTCAGLIAWSRPRLSDAMEAVTTGQDVYVLPPPRVLEIGSLGYRSALADYLWAHVLVTQGLRMGEKRPFAAIASYLEAVNHLDPDFREPYRLADSLMSFQIGDPDRADSVRKARVVLERGLRRFPYDSELWLNYGQFLAYIGVGMLPEGSEERKSWREDGARALVRAGELGGDEATSLRAMSAATILNRQGEVEAAILFLERLHAVAADDAVREDVGRRLTVLRQGRQASRDFALSQAYDALWRDSLPFAPRARLSILGPPVHVWACSGPQARPGAQCIRDWPSWAESALRKEGAAP